ALDAVEELVEPEDLGAALDAEPNARANWDGFQGSTKRAILEWIIAAKRPPTRASRVAETARLAAQGIRPTSGANQAAPSLNVLR
ncbi:MAG TPA: YdeI/OmpD-associated family protein, partial [Actinomycetota bacterium]|nr:YdeI/OmpD-associated family protein [Actinomycetota bacterium]